MTTTPNDGGPASEKTLRDWFAGMALQGCLAYSYVNPLKGNYHENCEPHHVASDMYLYADAMLAERAKQQEHKQ